MMRGATDLRNAKFENEEHRREITFLQSQLQSVLAEKEDTMRRLSAVKASAKQGLESTAQSLDGVRSALDGLKAQSTDAFAFAAQAKTSLPNIQELRNTVQDTLKALEPLFNDDGQLYKTAETKILVNELQLECTKSGQVADLLRERLQSLGSELIEAKSRVTEVESTQAADREALRTANASLSKTTDHIRELVEQLATRRTEVQEAVVAGGELELKLKAAEEQVVGLKEMIESQEAILGEKVALERENSKLLTLLGEREIRIADLESTHERLEAAISLSNQHSGQIRVLETQLTSKDDGICELNERIVQEQAAVRKLQSEIQELKHDLGSALAREESFKKELTHASVEKQQLKQELQSLSASLEEMKKELDTRVNIIHQTNTKCQVLEDRVEGQLISLRISKETIGTLQNRVTESEAQHARELEGATGKLSCQIAVLSEQKSALETKMNDLEATVRATQHNVSAVKGDYEDKLAKQVEGHSIQLEKQAEAHRVQLDLVQQRVEDAHKTIEDARSKVKSLEEELSFSRQELSAVRDDLQQAKLPSPAHKEAIDALSSEIMALREEKTEMVLRARSIDSRYRTGDLNEEEKVFISTLIQTSQAIHEQELVTKGNELRRRDNANKELQSRIKLLETTLAKHLKSQSKATIQMSNEKASLIDPAAWVPSSEKSTSPTQPTGEDDRPSVNVDNTITAKSTPAPIRTGARAPLATVPVPVLNALARSSPVIRPQTVAPTARSTPLQAKKTSATVQFAPENMKSSPLVYPSPKISAPGRLKTYKTLKQVAQSSKGGFRRLGTDHSDDIQDFDDLIPHLSPVQDMPEGPKAKLGKRDRTADAKSPNGARQAKKLRTGMRTRSITQQQDRVDSPITQSPETMMTKSRIRKRR
ncbi:hypothetical protein BDY19DRAFT_573185 [Irpex rosettiformis]|uniref:Uncharacterized protein n=1 Tax=Irpex rosettiformis TaxID=378272 RepID=A0ACB8UCC4_9APHY|nr:hypothetical protein BDY19DRAFT_573185 [Irpex rosettiformis]